MHQQHNVQANHSASWRLFLRTSESVELIDSLPRTTTPMICINHVSRPSISSRLIDDSAARHGTGPLWQ